MSKPTPEPWQVDQDPMGALIVSGPEGETVFYTGTMSEDEDCANAELVVDARKTAAERDRLKALNAEMLEALKSIEKHVINAFDEFGFFNPGSSDATGSVAFESVIRAIAKAEGRD